MEGTDIRKAAIEVVRVLHENKIPIVLAQPVFKEAMDVVARGYIPSVPNLQEKIAEQIHREMETEKMEEPEPIKLIIHAECEMHEVKELMKIMTEIQKEYSCNCTLDVKKYVVFH